MVAIGGIVAAPGVACAQGAQDESSSLLILVVAAILSIGFLGYFWKTDVIRPGSFRQESICKAPPPDEILTLFALLLVCFIVPSIASLLITSGMGMETTGGVGSIPQQGVHKLLLGLTGGVAVVAAMVFLHKSQELDRFAIGRTGWLLGLVLGALVFPLTLTISAISRLAFEQLGFGPGEAIAHEALNVMVAPESGGWRWAFIAAAVVATPIFEEIVFRGLLQSSLAAIIPWRWLAVLIASALFMAAHISPGIEPHTLPAIGTLGLAMGVAYERTGKISAPIAMHAAYNAINVGLAFVLSQAA